MVWGSAHKKLNLKKVLHLWQNVLFKNFRSIGIQLAEDKSYYGIQMKGQNVCCQSQDYEFLSLSWFPSSLQSQSCVLEGSQI